PLSRLPPGPSLRRAGRRRSARPSGRAGRSEGPMPPMTSLLKFLAFEAAIAAFLFGPAGRVDLPWFWALLGTHFTILSVGLACVDRELLRERMAPAPGGEDRKLRLWMAPFMAGQLVIAGLDVGRFHWTGPLPAWLQGAGLAVYAAGVALTVWAMVTNRYFSPV